MKLSIVIISHRPELLRRCLASLGHSDREATEILVLLNGQGDSAVRLRAELAARWPHVTAQDIPRTSRGAARNLAVGQTHGEILYFLDDDVLVPPGFCRRVVEKFERNPELCYGGGPNLCAPDATAFQAAVDAALNSPWGAGPMRVRYRPGGRDRLLDSWGFMLCNLGVRRRIFTEDGLAFPESCVSAEENLLLYRVQKRHGRGFFSPDLYVYHVRRQDIGGFCRQAFQCGTGRMQVTLLEPGSLQWVTLLPPAGLACLVLLCLDLRASAAAAVVALYAGACLLATLPLLRTTCGLAAAVRLPWVMALGHFCYAVGMLAGIGRAGAVRDRITRVCLPSRPGGLPASAAAPCRK